MTEKPKIFDLKNKEDKAEYLTLIKSKSKPRIADHYRDQVEELIEVDNPALLKNPEKHSEEIAKLNPVEEDGVWIYYPWRNTLVHTLDDSDYQRLRLSRNITLIKKDEEEKLKNLTVGIAGLNVGNAAAICLALEGIGKQMKFADLDILSVSNLNRFRASLTEVGETKVNLSAQQVYEINPYLGLTLFHKGLNPGNIESFLLEPKIDVLIEEMDNLPLKIKIREASRENKIPVIMVTGSGEDIILDVERFDKNPELDLLSGLLKGEIIEEVKNLKGAPAFEDKVRLARDFMGGEHLHPRLQESFLQLGSALAGIPQLAEASFLRGAILTRAIREIFTGNLDSGRYAIKIGDFWK